MQERQIKVFGLTGSICCGKSTASKLISNSGIPIIDADVVAREVVVADSVGLYQLVKEFGDDILTESATLDRSKLGSIVFGSSEKLSRLNAIMFPLIDGYVYNKINIYKNVGVKLVCFDAALIIETNQQNKYKPLIVVSCSPEIQLQRLMKRNSLSEKEAKARIESQLSSKEKESFADILITTNGTLEESKEQINKAIEQIKKEFSNEH